MLQDDYILRQIREMVRAVMKMLFQVSAVELTPDVIEDTDARQILTNLTNLAMVKLTRQKISYTK